MALKSFNVAKGLSVGSITTDVIDSSANITAAALTANGNVSFTGANVSLGAVANLRVTGGTASQFLQTDGTGVLSWATVSSTALENGNSNVTLDANANVRVSVGGTANTVVFTTTGANVAGTLDVVGNVTVANLTANGKTSLGNVGNVSITGGTNAQFLRTDGAGNLEWANVDTSKISNGTSFVSVPAAGGNIVANVGGALATTLSSTGLEVVGKLTANTANIANSATIGTNLAINGTEITSTNTGTANVLNANVTGLNIGSAATAVSIGASTGTLTVNNANTIVTGNLQVTSGIITTTATTANIVNATATTLNVGGAATAVNIGANSGTLTVGNPTLVGTQTTQNVFNTVATTVNAFGAANTISIGSATSTTTINHDAVVSGNLTVNGNLTYVDTTNLAINDPLISIGANNSSTSLDLGLYVTSGTTNFSGLARDHSDNVWKLFNTTTQPGTTADFTTLADIKVANGTATGNLDANNVNASNNITANATLSGGNITTAGTITINSIAKTGANTVTTTGVSPVVLSQVAAVKGGAVEFVIKGVDATNTKITTAKILAVTDGSTCDYTVYSLIEMGASAGTLSVAYANSAIELSVNASTNASTVWVTEYNKI